MLFLCKSGDFSFCPQKRLYLKWSTKAFYHFRMGVFVELVVLWERMRLWLRVCSDSQNSLSTHPKARPSAGYIVRFVAPGLARLNLDCSCQPVGSCRRRPLLWALTQKGSLRLLMPSIPQNGQPASPRSLVPGWLGQVSQVCLNRPWPTITRMIASHMPSSLGFRSARVRPRSASTV